jgi:excisionase family DNA binding protein
VYVAIMDRVLTQKEAAALLGVSPRTLERLRLTGRGPMFTRLGRMVRYRQQDLADFVDRNLRTSTSEDSLASDRGRS